MRNNNLSRRDFGKLLARAGAAGLACSALNSCAIASRPNKDAARSLKPIKLFVADLNWNWKNGRMLHSRPSDWATINAKEFFEWHVEMGDNAVFCQAYNWGGYAHYPSKLGPLGQGNSGILLPKLYEMAHKADLPFISPFLHAAWRWPSMPIRKRGSMDFTSNQPALIRICCVHGSVNT
jgi:hypothetical protein